MQSVICVSGGGWLDFAPSAPQNQNIEAKKKKKERWADKQKITRVWGHAHTQTAKLARAISNARFWKRCHFSDESRHNEWRGDTLGWPPAHFDEW